MPTFMIKVSSELAHSLRSNDLAKTSELLNVINEHGAKIGLPTDRAGEPSLYYSVEGVDEKRSDSLRRKLSALPDVDAAYAKPSDELP